VIIFPADDSMQKEKEKFIPETFMESVPFPTGSYCHFSGVDYPCLVGEDADGKSGAVLSAAAGTSWDAVSYP